MLAFKVIISLILLAVALLAAIFYSLTLIYNIILSAPFLSSNRRSIRIILEKIDLSDKKYFYELGSGRGRVVAQIAKKYPQLKCYGVELNRVAYLLAKGNNLFLKNKVKYLRQNLFKTDLSSADVVFTYLFPKPMVKLEPKFERELKPGAILISSTFKLSNKQPAEVYKGKGSLSTIYLYQY